MAKRGFDMDDDMQLLDGDELPRVSTGNAGLDDILGGGIDPERMYLFEGQPGSGKKTLALEFLLEGVRAGEPTLYITLSETEQELGLVAKRHGWSLKGITIFELIPPETTLDPSQELTVLHPAEMELSETTQAIFDRVEALAPARIVLGGGARNWRCALVALAREPRSKSLTERADQASTALKWDFLVHNTLPRQAR